MNAEPPPPAVLRDDALAGCVFDSIPARSVLLDRQGTIIAVNRAWLASAARFQADPRRVGVGRNYLRVCYDAVGPGSEGAVQAASAIERIIAGASRGFELEYGCTCGAVESWFVLRGARLEHETARAVLSHTDATEHLLPRNAARQRLAPLTRRELEVVELVMSGLVSEEIAEELGISRNTAENHRHAILRKTRLKNTAELVRLATLAELPRTGAAPERA